MSAHLSRRAALATIAASAAAPVMALAAQDQGAPASVPFPDGFVWGVAAAAPQTESRDGRGRSNWDVYADAPGAIRDGSSNARCIEFETRYGDDIALLAAAGVKAFRFSIAWPRVQPDGPGAPSAAGLDLYERMVDTMLAAGVQPWPTLFHWDSPLWADDLRERQMAWRLADYAGVVAGRLGDRVGDWILLNEPNILARFGYGDGGLAPGLRSADAARAATHHQMLAQGLMAQAVRARRPAARLGSAINLPPVLPAAPGPQNLEAARLMDVTWNRAFLDPMTGRGYPPEAGVALAPWILAGDEALLPIRPDFIGVNYYSRAYALAAPGAPGFVSAPAPPQTERTDYFDFEPDGLRETLLRVKADYGDIPLVVTETGFAERDPAPAGASIDDPSRIRHLRAYLAAAQGAAAAGANLKGLFYWAATDNWEWAQGFSKRFGLVAVDPTTQARTPKTSLAWYGRCARANRIV
jgi:beta-glucosidase